MVIMIHKSYVKWGTEKHVPDVAAQNKILSPSKATHNYSHYPQSPLATSNQIPDKCPCVCIYVSRRQKGFSCGRIYTTYYSTNYQLMTSLLCRSLSPPLLLYQFHRIPQENFSNKLCTCTDNWWMHVMKHQSPKTMPCCYKYYYYSFCWRELWWLWWW